MKSFSIKLISWLLFLALSLELTGCGSLENEGGGGCAASVKESGYLLSTDCRPLSWGQSIPIRIYYGSSLNQETISAFEEAIQMWESATGKNLFEALGTISDVGVENNIYVNTISLRSGSLWTAYPIEGKQDEPAKTIYYYKNFIYNADIFLNSNFSFSSDGNSKDTYDIVSIALHELGHVLGLDHDDSVSPQMSVMNSKIYKGMVRRTFSDRDIQRVKTLYPF